MRISNKQYILLFFLLSIVLCIPAFYNGFPLFFTDSLGYIISGFEGKAGNTRLWLYGGFIRHVSLWESLWLVLLAQGIILIGAIHLIFKYFFPSKYLAVSLTSYICMIAATTAASFHVSMLMPDIFTPIVLLSFCLLLLATNISRRDFAIVVFLFLLSSGMHNSHTLLNLILLLVVLLGRFLKGGKARYQQLGITGRKLAFMMALVGGSYLTTCTIQYSRGGGFVGTEGGGIFLFARLCDFGLAQSYLEENCKEFDHDICGHIKSLGLGRYFLWSPGSYLNKKDLWHWSDEKVAFYNELCWKILTQPKYLKKYIIRSLEATLMQLSFFDYNNQEDMGNTKDRPFMAPIKPYFPTYYLAGQDSRQVLKTYTEQEVYVANFVQKVVLYLSAFIVLMAFFFYRGYSEQEKALATLLILGILVNAFIVASTSGVYDRYNSRVAWLITLPAFGLVWNILKTRKARDKKLI